MSDEMSKIEELLRENGPIAIVGKQRLRPVEGDGEPIFPPTYPMPAFTGRVHTVKDGDYRVSVELPPYRQGESKGGSEKTPGYNIDEFPDGTNICEIDSVQSQANRMEPIFEKVGAGKLVPQIRIKVGKDSVVSLLSDAGHRAADAVVRMSSMVDQFHVAFKEVQKGNHVNLAKLAPTSILFGVWDSRGTQVKLPRIIKSEIRATNVSKLTRSAQFNPAIDFVGTGAVSEGLDDGEGNKNPLSAEGMKHVPAPRALGGVIVRGSISRTFRINLTAIRQLRALRDGVFEADQTSRLQNYLLGLALVAATAPQEANLREGCLLCGVGDGTLQGVMSDGEEQPLSLNAESAFKFAEHAAKAFVEDSFETKDILDAVFESGVANEFLAMEKADRDRIARNGPITAAAIRAYKEKRLDPFKSVLALVLEIKSKLKKSRGGSQPTVQIGAESWWEIKKQVEEICNDEERNQVTRDCAKGIMETLPEGGKPLEEMVSDVEKKIREFNKKQKELSKKDEPEDLPQPQ